MSRSMLKFVSGFRGLRHLSSRMKLPVNSLHVKPSIFVGRALFSHPFRPFSSQIDRKFTEVLSNEIKQEKENMYTCGPPKGFSVAKAEGTEIILHKQYTDGVTVEIEINLAGSVNPDIDEAEDLSNTEKKEELPMLEAHPDIRIRLIKGSGKSVIFNCSLPSRDTRQQLSADGDPNLPTYSVDSVEMEGLPGYFVYTDLFDDNMYDHTMQLLMERQLDANFQNELQDFCTAEEHKLYLKFLDEFHAYCRD